MGKGRPEIIFNMCDIRLERRVESTKLKINLKYAAQSQFIEGSTISSMAMMVAALW